MAKEKMSNKQVLKIGLAVIAVCLIISGIYLVVNRSTSREPTQEELETYTPYAVETLNTQSVLSQCTEVGEEEIGEHTYTTFTSDTLGAELYQCAEITEIIMNEAGTLHISYLDTVGRTVIIGFSDEGMIELAVYDEPTDTLFHIINGTTTVWQKFRNGIQWGA